MFKIVIVLLVISVAILGESYAAHENSPPGINRFRPESPRHRPDTVGSHRPQMGDKQSPPPRAPPRPHVGVTPTPPVRIGGGRPPRPHIGPPQPHIGGR